MVSTQEVRLIFKYEFKLGHRAAEAAYNINSVFGDNTVTARTVQRWFTKFRTGNMDTHNEPRGRPKPVLDREQLLRKLESNPQASVRALAKDLGISAATVSRHIKAIGKIKKFVPHKLNETQKLRRLKVCSEHIVRLTREPFLERIVTCDEKWYSYDSRKRTSNSLENNEGIPLPPKKIMITVWWTSEGVVHFSAMGAEEIITPQSYCQQIIEMHTQLSLQQPLLVNCYGPIVLHDNAKHHTSPVTVSKLTELGYEILQHPPYSSDILPTNYHIFKHFDLKVHGRKFTNKEEIISAFTEFVTSKPLEFYRGGILALQDRWEQVVALNGDHFD